MGQTNSIPSGTRYRMSFCQPEHFYECTKVYNTVDLSKFVKGSNVSQFVKGYNLIYSSFLYKIIFNGFNIKKVKNNGVYEKGYLDEIIHAQISAFGAKQVKLQPVCYFPTLANIRKLLSTGNILIAGLFINQELHTYLELGQIPHSKKISDIVLLVGYDEINLFVIFDWKMGITLLPISEFRNNFKEIWNIDLISPEEYFLNLNVPE